MLKRLVVTSLTLGLVLGLVAMASAYTYKRPAGKDCGKASYSGGFGGPAPSNVPKNATPQLHTLVVSGKVACAQAKRVMAQWERSFLKSGVSGKGTSPAGWRCAFSKKEGGNECASSSTHAVVANGIIYVVPKK